MMLPLLVNVLEPAIGSALSDEKGEPEGTFENCRLGIVIVATVPAAGEPGVVDGVAARTTSDVF